MKRSVEALVDRSFDLIVVGGGIYGACLCWEATLRGLSVALLEKGDFGGATSANMHRILHGGFRYLSKLDVKRIRESVRERNTLMRLAPHLTEPLPFLVPTRTSGVERRELMRVALKLYDGLSHGRNRGIEEASRRIPPGRIVSREECLRLVPGLDPRGVTGGAIWYDGALRDPARLTLEFVRTAAEAGAAVANYVEVTGFARSDRRVRGVSATDLLSGDRFDLRAAAVVSAAGPWTDLLLGKLEPDLGRKPTPYVRSVDIVTRPVTRENHGLALTGRQPGAPQQLIRYFVAPWRGLSVVGSVDYMEGTDPDHFRIEAHELEHLVGVLRGCMPGCTLSADDILCVQAGLIPHAGTEPLDDPYHAARHYRIVDHARRDGVEGLFSVMGIKYTTARDIAQKTVDLILRRLGRAAPPSRSASSPLHGGQVGELARFVRQACEVRPAGLPATAVERLVRSHGSAYGELLALCGEDGQWTEPLAASSAVLKLEVVHAVRSEMAVKLSDVVLRRTELGAIEHPGAPLLRDCARLMASLLHWGQSRVEKELAETEAQLARFWVRAGGVRAGGVRAGGARAGAAGEEGAGR